MLTGHNPASLDTGGPKVDGSAPHFSVYKIKGAHKVRPFFLVRLVGKKPILNVIFRTKACKDNPRLLVGISFLKKSFQSGQGSLDHNPSILGADLKGNGYRIAVGRHGFVKGTCAYKKGEMAGD